MESNLFLYFLYSRLKLLYILSSLFISMQNSRNLNVYQSEIKLVIKGSGYSNFLNNDFNPAPSEVIINNEIKASGIKSYTFTEDLNYVIIKFNNPIESCEKMFNGLDNIIEIDLSNFDTSKVKSMSRMFNDCLNIEKINLGKINTSSVQNMYRLFHNCTKLTSIDVSNFDTSSVTNMEAMFAKCRILPYFLLSLSPRVIVAPYLILKFLKLNIFFLPLSHLKFFE